MTKRKSLGKGPTAEEALREYFLSLGYFVVRSVAFNYKGFDVTDIDLWLYMKSSSLTRERVCVDVKRKRTPQSLERVFWSKGLREVLDLDRAVVATTDNRVEIRDFGASHDVTVLPGEFLQRVIRGYGNDSSRVTEEAFLLDLKMPCILDSKIQWPRFYREAKTILLMGLNFNGCNLLLTRLRFLLEEFQASKASRASCRLVYALAAYFLLAVDYSSRLVAHLDIVTRKARFCEGFRYGEAGKARAQEIVNTALQLLSETSRSDMFSRTMLEEEIGTQLSEFPAEVLAEYCSKPEILKEMFSLAREFEQIGFSHTLPMPAECSVGVKGFIGVVCDFLKVDRKNIL